MTIIVIYITETETLKAIDNLENKNRSGHDGISTM